MPRPFELVAQHIAIARISLPCGLADADAPDYLFRPGSIDHFPTMLGHHLETGLLGLSGTTLSYPKHLAPGQIEDYLGIACLLCGASLSMAK